eukprot:g6151.t1
MLSSQKAGIDVNVGSCVSMTGFANPSYTVEVPEPVLVRGVRANFGDRKHVPKAVEFYVDDIICPVQIDEYDVERNSACQNVGAAPGAEGLKDFLAASTAGEIRYANTLATAPPGRPSSRLWEVADCEDECWRLGNDCKGFAFVAQSTTLPNSAGHCYFTLRSSPSASAAADTSDTTSGSEETEAAQLLQLSETSNQEPIVPEGESVDCYARKTFSSDAQFDLRQFGLRLGVPGSKQEPGAMSKEEVQQAWNKNYDSQPSFWSHETCGKAGIAGRRMRLTVRSGASDAERSATATTKNGIADVAPTDTRLHLCELDVTTSSPLDSAAAGGPPEDSSEVNLFGHDITLLSSSSSSASSSTSFSSRNAEVDSARPFRQMALLQDSCPSGMAITSEAECRNAYAYIQSRENVVPEGENGVNLEIVQPSLEAGLEYPSGCSVDVVAGRRPGTDGRSASPQGDGRLFSDEALNEQLAAIAENKSVLHYKSSRVVGSASFAQVGVSSVGRRTTGEASSATASLSAPAVDEDFGNKNKALPFRSLVAEGRARLLCRGVQTAPEAELALAISTDTEAFKYDGPGWQTKRATDFGEGNFVTDAFFTPAKSVILAMNGRKIEFELKHVLGGGGRRGGKTSRRGGSTSLTETERTRERDSDDDESQTDLEIAAVESPPPYSLAALVQAAAGGVAFGDLVDPEFEAGAVSAGRIEDLVDVGDEDHEVLVERSREAKERRSTADHEGKNQKSREEDLDDPFGFLLEAKKRRRLSTSAKRGRGEAANENKLDEEALGGGSARKSALSDRRHLAPLNRLVFNGRTTANRMRLGLWRSNYVQTSIAPHNSPFLPIRPRSSEGVGLANVASGVSDFEESRSGFVDSFRPIQLFVRRMGPHLAVKIGDDVEDFRRTGSAWSEFGPLKIPGNIEGDAFKSKILPAYNYPIKAIQVALPSTGGVAKAGKVLKLRGPDDWGRTLRELMMGDNSATFSTTNVWAAGDPVVQPLTAGGAGTSANTTSNTSAAMMQVRAAIEGARSGDRGGQHQSSMQDMFVHKGSVCEDEASLDKAHDAARKAEVMFFNGQLHVGADTASQCTLSGDSQCRQFRLGTFPDEVSSPATKFVDESAGLRSRIIGTFGGGTLRGVGLDTIAAGEEGVPDGTTGVASSTFQRAKIYVHDTSWRDFLDHDWLQAEEQYIVDARNAGVVLAQTDEKASSEDGELSSSHEQEEMSERQRQQRQSPGAPTFVGCYALAPVDRGTAVAPGAATGSAAFQKMVSSYFPAFAEATKQSLSICSSMCQQTAYFGLYGGDAGECRCSDTLQGLTKVAAKECSKGQFKIEGCNFDAQYCGAPQRLSVYATDSVASVRTTSAKVFAKGAAPAESEDAPGVQETVTLTGKVLIDHPEAAAPTRAPVTTQDCAVQCLARSQWCVGFFFNPALTEKQCILVATLTPAPPATAGNFEHHKTQLPTHLFAGDGYLPVASGKRLRGARLSGYSETLNKRPRL